MTQSQITELKTMGVIGVIKKYLPRIGKTPEEGGITKEMYDHLLRLVTPAITRLPAPSGAVLPGSPGSSEDLYRDQRGREAPPQDPTPYTAFKAPTATSPGTHTDPEKGRSQTEKILIVLSDGQWHTTVEIMNSPAYNVPGERGNCRIPSRIFDLRQAGHNIETKRITKTLFAYKLV